MVSLIRAPNISIWMVEYNVDYYKPALWGKTIEAWGDVACLRPFLMLLFLCWPSCYFWIRMCTTMLLLNDDGIASSLYSAALYLIQNTVVSILNLWRSLRFSFLKSCLPSYTYYFWFTDSNTIKAYYIKKKIESLIVLL